VHQSRVKTVASEYIEKFIEISKACSGISYTKPDKYHLLCKVFFDKFYRKIESICSARSVGDKNILSKSFESSIIESINESTINIAAESSPTIEWDFRKCHDFPRKQLDIFIFQEGNDERAIAIEIKGRAFNQIAAAMMEFAVANKYGKRLTKGNFAIHPSKVKFINLLHDSTENDFIYFDMQKNIFPANLFDADIHCIFLSNFIANDDIASINKNCYHFFKDVCEFF